MKNPNKLEFHSLRNYKESEIKKCLLSFGIGYFVFQFAMQTHSTATLSTVLFARTNLRLSHAGSNIG